MQVDSDIVIECDWDNDGDFDEPEENITSYVMELETKTGRDWPSQLTGKAGPGAFKATLDNTDDRFSYFNAASPLNTAPFSLKTGRKLRVRTNSASNPDPSPLARDRFRRAAGSLGSDEVGLAWTNHLTASWVISDEQAVVQLVVDSSGAVTASDALATVDVGATDLYAQLTMPQRDGTNQIGLVYRLTDANNYGAVIWQGQGGHTEAAHFTVVAGVVTETFSSGDIEFQEDTTIGVLVDDTVASIYVNGVRMATGTAYSGAGTRAGFYGDWDENRLPVVDDFYVWAGLPSEEEGVLWTGDVSDLTVSVATGPRKLAYLSGEGWLAKLAAVDIDPPKSVGIDNLGFSGQTTGELVGKSLAKAGLLHPPGVIQRGDVRSGSVGLAAGKALAVARQFEELEFGFLYESQEGPINFDARTARDASYSLATFSDAPSATLGYESIVPRDWRREVVNQVAAGVSGRPVGLISVPADALNNPAATPTDVSILLKSASDGLSVGDLMLVIIAPTMDHPANNQQWITPHGWTAFNASGELGKVRIYAKKVTTTDLGATVQFFDDASTFGGNWYSRTFLITNWYGDIANGVHVSAPASFGGDDAEAGLNDPPVIFPPWGKESSLFITSRAGMVSVNGGAVSGTAGPNGYNGPSPLIFLTSGLMNGSVNAYDVALEVCARWGNADIENPSPFTGTFSGFLHVENHTIAVRGFNGDPPPANAAFREVVTNDFASQDAHNAVRSHRNPANLFRSEADARTYGNLVLARYADDRPIFEIGFTATQSADHRDQAVARRVGDRITLVADNDTGLNVNDDFHIESIANKWTNGAKLWKVTWELSPAVDVNRADTTESELGVTIDADDAVIRIDTIDGPPWISSFVYPNMFPVAVQIDTEIIRLLSNTSDPDNTSPQFYNVERGIDGTTAAAHTAGATVSLAYPWVLP